MSTDASATEPQATQDAAPEDTRTAAQIEADIARTREELRATIDQLSERLSPSNLAKEAVDEARIAAEELRRKVTAQPRPADAPEPTRLGWVVLGTAAALTTLVVVGIARKL